MPTTTKLKNMRFVPEETVFKNVNVEINKNNSAENIKTFSLTTCY